MKKRSLGTLRQSTKTKPRSPDCIGSICIQRHTLDAFMEQMPDSGDDELWANLAGWKNHDAKGAYLTVELSPKYISRRQSEPAARSIFDFQTVRKWKRLIDNDQFLADSSS